MPRYDGSGPKQEGPMTGRGMGYCILKKDSKDPSHIEGFAGKNLKPVNLSLKNKKEVMDMPAGDGTGPAGRGPMTGRSAGYCAGYSKPGFLNSILGRMGFGAGRGGYPRGGGGGRAWGGGRGRGFETPFNSPRVSPYDTQLKPEDETNSLKNNISNLEKEIKDSKERIKELEAKKKEIKKA